MRSHSGGLDLYEDYIHCIGPPVAEGPIELVTSLTKGAIFEGSYPCEVTDPLIHAIFIIFPDHHFSDFIGIFLVTGLNFNTFLSI